MFYDIVIDCGSPGTPINGMTSVDSTTVGSFVSHSCDDEFILCGSENRTCQDDGMWSGSLPECISKLVLHVLHT